MGHRGITITVWVLLLGGVAATALGVLGITDTAREHHFALLATGISSMTVAAMIFWLQRFSG